MLEKIILAMLILVGAVLGSAYRGTRPYAFAIWVVAFVATAFWIPEWFSTWGNAPSNRWVSPLIQVAMFGMGATLTLGDFTRVLLLPKAVGIGMLLQFTVMPFMGWFLATVFRLPNEVAVGVILIGACPGGVASNVITYLAKGNVPLSVTMTACSTLAAPVMTPLMLSLLAGRMIEIPFWNMMIQILWIVLLPIGLGILANYWLTKARWDPAWTERGLSLIAMIAICIICAIIVADAGTALRSVGWVLLLVVALHNLAGYLFGYWVCRWSGFDEAVCRTVAIEVGLQNGGMGATLATTVLKSSQIAMASAIFGPWMSVAGSFLAAWWRHHSPTNDEKKDACDRDSGSA